MYEFDSEHGGLCYAHGGPLGEARLKEQFEDFKVTEVLGFDLEGSGEHYWLFIEKTNLNTADVAQQLQALCSVSNAAIGHSGLKDRRAVTQQWFSVHLPGQSSPDWAKIESADLKVLKQDKHNRKLRVGVHKANRFEVVLRKITADSAHIESRMQTLLTKGAPNYFGEQRFGNNGRNLHLASRLFQRTAGKPFKPRRKDGMLLSAVRSQLFNEVLSERVRDESWLTAQEGEVYQFEEGSTLFASDDLLAEQQRLDQQIINLTGPLYGKGGKPATAHVQQIEKRIFDVNTKYCEGLMAAGMKASRRSLRMIPQDLQWHFRGDCLLLSFQLQKGSFATSLIREIVQTNID